MNMGTSGSVHGQQRKHKAYLPCVESFLPQVKTAMLLLPAYLTQIACINALLP